MSSRRYTVLIANRSSGVMRQVTVSLLAVVAAIITVMALPVLMGLGAKWSSRSEIDQLRSANSSLTIENGSYRAATGELTAQIQSLESAHGHLSRSVPESQLCQHVGYAKLLLQLRPGLGGPGRRASRCDRWF